MTDLVRSIKCGNEFTVNGASIKKVVVVGAGKAGAGMSQGRFTFTFMILIKLINIQSGVIDVLGDRWPIKGLVNIPGSEEDVISFLTRGEKVLF